ncbi:MAG: radical SAM protein, partial [Bdellovibrionota bacterium]
MSSDFFKKYDIPAPRYTSYPTVPYWSDNPTTEQWMTEVSKTFKEKTTKWSMYIHVPFCETLCTFCGCNTTITKDHGREEPYVQLVHREWDNYLKQVPEMAERPLVQFHLGGGTPTFLSPMNLRRLIEPIFASVQKDPDHFEGALEVDPRRTTREQLAVLRDLGFSRVSMGVQDFNP